MDALGVENREVGKQWVVAQARVQELETDEEKLTGQLDKMMARVEGLEAEKEQVRGRGGLEGGREGGEGIALFNSFLP